MAGDEWGKEDHDRLVRMEEQLSGLKIYVEARLEAMETARTQSSDSLEKRLDSMNEFRGQLKDQAAQLMPRNEFDLQHNKVCEDIRGLRESRAELAGKADQSSVNWAYILSAIGIILATVGVVHGFWGG